ncbi:glutaredoxin [Sporormia fimetaria CBS 119925]|uniref:Glutaredoxin n=1 Tax=Sporormia fimetaria CBS 119925 TaxID=1340428 RepID=A0A6A6UWJ6_9PLEO|nr:glutaredoxin [Sporormia fimetaria CBS 119925]
MPSQRRTRAFVLIVALVILITIYITSGEQQTLTSDFYTKTQEALQAKEYEAAARERDAVGVDERLKAAADAAKQAANEKGQQYIDSVEGPGEKSVAGRVKLNTDDGEKKFKGVAMQGGKSRDSAEEKVDETPEDHEIEMELNAILKKSPVIIFSKSYCPHSARAKHILLDVYNIKPAPHVVELDEHPLGDRLQAELAKSTGRRTVPNVLVMAASIGGGDEIAELDATRKLEDTLKAMMGSRAIEVSRKEVHTNAEMTALR